MSQPPKDEETLFTPIAKTLIETVNATQDVLSFLCKAGDKTNHLVVKSVIEAQSTLKKEPRVDNFKNTLDRNPEATIVGSTVLTGLLFSRSKFFRPIPLSMLCLAFTMKYYFPDKISDYAKISVDHYNRLRERLSNVNENEN